MKLESEITCLLLPDLNSYASKILLAIDYCKSSSSRHPQKVVAPNFSWFLIGSMREKVALPFESLPYSNESPQSHYWRMQIFNQLKVVPPMKVVYLMKMTKKLVLNMVEICYKK